MDATHLAEFFQVEGVVADYDITLGHLIGMSISLHPLTLTSSLTVQSYLYLSLIYVPHAGKIADSH